MGLTGRIGRYALLLAMAVLVLVGCIAQRGEEPGKAELQEYDKSIFVMDTIVTVQLFSDSAGKAESVFTDIQRDMARLESILSAHLPESDIAKIDNAAGTNPVKVHPETLAVLKTALEYSQRTEDSFDVTLAPVLRLYNFSPGKETRPSRSQLETNLPLVDWRNVQVDEGAGTVFLTEENMKIDLGGIAKGYITDQAISIMVEHGIEYGLVNAGGDIRLLGPKIDGSPWRVGIKDPNNPNTNNFAIIEVSSGAIVTSGDYERYYIDDGVRYHHIIDPKSGLPADKARSVTVTAPSAEVADLLSTALFVMGPESGLALVESLPEVETIIWSQDGEVLWSSGLNLIPGQSLDYYFRIQ